MRMWNDRNSHSSQWVCGMVQQTGMRAGPFLTKLNILLSFDPAITFLCIYPNELETHVHTKTCTQMFLAAFLRIAENWKQSRCPSMDEWIEKTVGACIWWNTIRQKMRSELSSHEKTRRNPKCILLTKRSQFEKAMHSMTPTTWQSGKRKTRDSRKVPGKGGTHRWCTNS